MKDLTTEEKKVLKNVSNTLYLLVRDGAVDKKVTEILLGCRAALQKVARNHGVIPLYEMSAEYKEKHEWPENISEAWEAIK